MLPVVLSGIYHYGLTTGHVIYPQGFSGFLANGGTCEKWTWTLAVDVLEGRREHIKPKEGTID